ncbi:MAG: hypothetical protein H7318_13145 [Oligoflexus sp.]|nr:hypothetical protein [Oligoflexus sp.]
MLKQALCALGILVAMTACGEGPSKKTPRNKEIEPTYVPVQAATKSVTGGSTTTSGTTGGATPLAGNPTAPGASAAAGTAFALTAVKSSAWESNCYRFSLAGDYSKKYWSFGADTMTSLLLKYSDDTCKTLSKNTDGTAKAWSTWVIGSLVNTARVDNWAVVSGTCAKGCTGDYKTAMRATAEVLNEGSKIGTATPEAFNTSEGKYVSYTKLKTQIDLESLASTLSNGAVAAPTTPRAPATPVVFAESTGLGMIASLADQSWTTCYVAKNTEGTLKVDRGFKRSLAFKKGAELKDDGYSSDLVVYTNTDCTGDVLSTKGQLNYSNLIVAAGPTEGWILVTTQTCAAACTAVKSLMKLPAATVGLQEAGENKTAGTFYTETPRVYTLNP